jgi:hypothetical protein
MWGTQLPELPMYLRFTRSLITTLWITADDGEVESRQKIFLQDQVYLVGEMSPSSDNTTTFEFINIGCADIPDECWVESEDTFYRFDPGKERRN